MVPGRKRVKIKTVRGLTADSHQVVCVLGVDPAVLVVCIQVTGSDSRPCASRCVQERLGEGRQAVLAALYMLTGARGLGLGSGEQSSGDPPTGPSATDSLSCLCP